MTESPALETVLISRDGSSHHPALKMCLLEQSERYRKTSCLYEMAAVSVAPGKIARLQTIFEVWSVGLCTLLYWPMVPLNPML